MKRTILILLALAVCTAPAVASGLYLITVDTTSLAPGTTGFIDLAFVGGGPVEATIADFLVTGGSLSGSPSIQGAIGTLPDTVTMPADNADYFEGISFGSSVSFQLTLAGNPIGPGGDTFTLTFFDSTQMFGLLSGNANDLWLVQFQMSADGSTTYIAYDNPSGGPSFANVTSVPEPATASLAVLVLAGAALLKTRGRFRRASRVAA